MSVTHNYLPYDKICRKDATVLAHSLTSQNTSQLHIFSLLFRTYFIIYHFLIKRSFPIIHPKLSEKQGGQVFSVGKINYNKRGMGLSILIRGLFFICSLIVFTPFWYNSAIAFCVIQTVSFSNLTSIFCSRPLID